MTQPLLSIITPSIRPRGLVPIFSSLKEQSYDNWEWLPRLSVPREAPDLSYQMNQALKEAKGDIMVFIQDHILLRPASLERIVDLYTEYGDNVAWTFPTGKVTTFDNPHASSVKWDWRKENTGGTIPYNQLEIDFAYIPKVALDKVNEDWGYYFDEGFDKTGGFSCENVELAWRLADMGMEFRCDAKNTVLVLDHEELNGHEWPRDNDLSAQYMREKIREMERQRIRECK